MTIVEEIEKQIEKTKLTTTAKNIGQIIELGDGVARVSGLSDVSASEIIKFPHDIYGLALNLEEDSVGIIIFGDWAKLKEGDECHTTGKTLQIPVGDGLIGRVVDALGNPLDGKGPVKTTTSYPAEKIAPDVIFSHPVNTPQQTSPGFCNFGKKQSPRPRHYCRRLRFRFRHHAIRRPLRRLRHW